MRVPLPGRWRRPLIGLYTSHHLWLYFWKEFYPWLTKVTLFCTVGLISWLPDLAAFFVLTNVFGIPYKRANVAAIFLSFVIDFTLQRKWTFNGMNPEKIRRQFGEFVAKSIVLSAFGIWLLPIIVERAQIAPFEAKLIMGPLIAAISFLLNVAIFHRS